MIEVTNNQEFESAKFGEKVENRAITLRIELNGGSAELQAKKSDDTFISLKTYSTDEMDNLSAPLKQRYRFVLTGSAKAFISSGSTTY